MAGLHVNRGRKRAREARAALGLDAAAPLDDVLRIVEEEGGVNVFVVKLPPTVAGAYTCPAGRASAFVSCSQATGRQRFTLAHEFGHHFIGHREAPTVDTFETLGGKTTSRDEVEANNFAAEFLVPQAGLAERLDGRADLEVVLRLAAIYGVSAIAMTYRLHEADLVPTAVFKRLQAEIDEGLHHTLWDDLGLLDLADTIATCEPPRVPAGVDPGVVARLY